MQRFCQRSILCNPSVETALHAPDNAPPATGVGVGAADLCVAPSGQSCAGDLVTVPGRAWPDLVDRAVAKPARNGPALRCRWCALRTGLPDHLHPPSLEPAGYRMGSPL